jgi:WD40 repeat protein
MRAKKIINTSYKIAIAVCIFSGVIAMAAFPSNAAGISSSASLAATQKIPVPKLEATIDLSKIGSQIAIRKLSFSSDGRYLAIVVDPEFGKTDIVVWDVENGKKQSHIHCPYQYGVLDDHDLLWNRDGSVISFGAKRQWNPITGDALPDNPATGRGARLNKDKTKLLTIVGFIGDPSYIHIYDVNTWELQKVYADGLYVEAAAWTSEDKILVGLHTTRETLHKTFDGYTIKQGNEVALRLIDPSGKAATKGVWFPAVRDEQPNSFHWKQENSVDISVPNFKKNIVALGANRFVDGETLEIFSYYSLKQIKSDDTPGGGGKAFSADGKFLFIKDIKPYPQIKPAMNSIIDTILRKEISRFTGGNTGIAVNPNGKQLAIGDGLRVQILNLQ